MFNLKAVKIIFIVFSLILFIYIYNSFISSNKINSDDLIFIKIKSDNIHLVEDFIYHLNSFEDLVSESFIDNRSEILFNFSLKNSSLNELRHIYSLIEYPDLIFSLNSIYTNLENNDFDIYYLEKLNMLLIEFVKYFNSHEINKNIGYDILETMLLSRKKYNDNQIIIIPQGSYSSNREQILFYDNLFSLIYDLNNEIDNIDKIIINNEMILDRFNKSNYKVENKMKLDYKECIIIYSDNIVEYELQLNILDSLFSDLEFDSVFNYMTKKDIRNEKFKFLKKISRNYNNNFDYNSISEDFIKLVSSMEHIFDKNNHNIEDKVLYNNLISDCNRNIDLLEKYLNDNANKIKILYLLSEYYKSTKLYINKIANVENISFSNVDSNIKRIFYHDKQQKFITRIYNFNEKDKKNITNLY